MYSKILLNLARSILAAPPSKSLVKSSQMMLRDWPSSEVALEVSAASAETREQAARAVNGGRKVAPKYTWPQLGD